MKCVRFSGLLPRRTAGASGRAVSILGLVVVRSANNDSSLTGDDDAVPVGPLVCPIVGTILDRQLNLLSCELSQVDCDLEPFILGYGLGPDNPIDQHFSRRHNSKLPVPMGMMADSQVQVCFLILGDLQFAIETAWRFSIQRMRLNCSRIAKYLVVYDTTFTHIANLESGGNFLDGPLPFGGLFLLLGAIDVDCDVSGDHQTRDEFL